MAEITISFTLGNPGHALAHLTLDALLHMPSDDDDGSLYLNEENLGWLVDELGMGLVRLERLGVITQSKLGPKGCVLLERYKS